jgi:LPXTG-motif cell wall-anchored protein
MKKLIFAIVLVFMATIAFAQFFANWPETNESPSAAYIVAGIFLILSISLLVVGYRQENQKIKDDYHFRKDNESEHKE